jgi:hypothetical protein
MYKTFIFLTLIIQHAKLFAQFEYRGNVFYSYEENITIYLEANFESRKSANKEDYIYSLLRVYEDKDNNNVEILNADLSEINSDKSFTCTIADNYQKNTRKFIVIKQKYQFYVFDIRKRKLVGPFKPKFWGVTNDANAGIISNIKISENGNLIYGSITESGGFLYNVCDISNPYEIISSNLPFLTTGRFYEIKNCNDDFYSGIYVLEEYGNMIFNEIISNKKLNPVDNSKIKELSEDEKEDIIMNITLNRSRYIILEDISSEKLKYIVIDIFTGNIVNLPENESFADKKSVYHYIDK